MIEIDNPFQVTARLKETLQKWLCYDVHATWNKLEVTLTNINRAKLGLDPVDAVYGKDVYYEWLWDCDNCILCLSIDKIVNLKRK